MKKIVYVILFVLGGALLGFLLLGNDSKSEVETPEVEAPESETPKDEVPEVEDTSCEYMLYKYATETGYSSTYEVWCTELLDETVNFRTVDEDIQWKYSSDDGWFDLYELVETKPTWYTEFLTGDVVPYSVYYTVSFDTGFSDTIASQIILSGECATQKLIGRLGYNLSGWYLGEDSFSFSTPINEKTNLTAKWTAVTFTIDYVLYDSINDPSNPDEYNIETEYTFQAPSKDGYEFVGWYTDSKFTTEITSLNQTVTNLILYACFEREIYTDEYGNQYQFNDVSFVLIKGSESSSNMIIPSEINGFAVTDIYESAFRGYTSLISITLPDGLDNIGTAAFYQCSNLVYIGIPSSVTSIGSGAFSECGSLTSATLPNGITKIEDSLFSFCRSLTSIEIPTGVTSIGNSAFRDCSLLTSIVIPEGVTSIGVLSFYGCSKILNIQMPSTMTSIGDSAFRGCTLLTSIVIPEGVTSIGLSTFYKCTSLTSVTLPSTLINIDGYAFYDCNSLTSVTLPSTLINIDGYAFYNCNSLTSITIPTEVTSIGEYAFWAGSSLIIYTSLEEAPSGWENEWNGTSEVKFGETDPNN